MARGYFLSRLRAVLGIGIVSAMSILAACGADRSKGVSQSESPVIMTLHSGEEVMNPTDEQILQALRSLDVDRDGEGFAILERGEMTYLQVSGDRSAGFDMEYQEGGIEKHYRADRTDFVLIDVVMAFRQYRDGTINWADYGTWSLRSW